MLLSQSSFEALEMPRLDLSTENKAIFHGRGIPAECFRTFPVDSSFRPIARRAAAVPGSRWAARDWLSDTGRRVMGTLRDGTVTNQSRRGGEGR